MRIQLPMIWRLLTYLLNLNVILSLSRGLTLSVCVSCVLPWVSVGVRGLGARESRSALQRHVQHISLSHDGYTYPLQHIYVDVCGPWIEKSAGESVVRVRLRRDGDCCKTPATATDSTRRFQCPRLSPAALYELYITMRMSRVTGWGCVE